MTTKNTASESEINASIELVPYDSTWPKKFELEAAAIQRVLSPWLVSELEHVGSTAVPGMVAKPVIDIMGPVASLKASREAIEAASELGYIYWPYKSHEMHWFCKPSAAHRTHHLHLMPFKSRLWNERLKFRDALRQDQSVAAEYKALKVKLAEKHRDDREAYTEGKSEFVLRIASWADAEDRCVT